MPNAWNAALLIDNLADRGVITASSTVPLTPAALVQNRHVARKMRFGATTGQYLVADLGAPVQIDTVALFGLTMTAAGTTRIRGSLADSSGADVGTYDSGAAAGRVDPVHAALIHLAPASFTARYLRVDLSDAAIAALDVGRLVIGRRQQLRHNFSFDWTRRYVDRSRRTESRGGQTYIDADNSYRVVELSFAALTEAERYGVIESMDRVNGTREDVLLLLNPASDRLARDSIWGLAEDLTPVTQPMGWGADGPIYTKSIRIRERL